MAPSTAPTPRDKFMWAMQKSCNLGHRWVLCRHFIPWVDVAVLARAGAGIDSLPLDGQWPEVVRALDEWIGYHRPSRALYEVASLAGFCLRCWHVSQRPAAQRRFGPPEAVFEAGGWPADFFAR